MDLKLADKTALVTGATAGIGLAIAKPLASEGVRVIIPGRKQEKLDTAATEIAKGGGPAVKTVVADVASSEGAKHLLEAIPSVDILVNNLGIYESREFSTMTTPG